MRISVIIPAFNEEKLLPKLLGDLFKQSLQPDEVIVADADSTDCTAAKAREAGCRVVKGGMPAVGRNAGAAVANGELLIFLDADARISKHFLSLVQKEVDEKFLDLATCELVPISKEDIDKTLFLLTNLTVRLSSHTTNPRAAGSCIIVTKRLFERVGGFDQKLRLAEDHNFVKRACAFRKLQVLDSPKVRISVRRLTKEGRLRLINKYLKVELYLLFKGDITKDIIEYEFGDYQKKQHKRHMMEQLRKLQTDVDRLIRKGFLDATIKQVSFFQNQVDKFVLDRFKRR